MTKHFAKFSSADQTLTVIAQQGKKGWNVKASLKTGSGKGTPKAKPGCREQFKKEDEAVAAFNKLVAEAKKAGWTKVEVASKNSFTTIPAPAAKGLAKTKAA